MTSASDLWHYVFFEIHPLLTTSIVFLHGIIFAGIAYVFAGWIYRRLGPNAIPVAPYFVSITTLLAIVFAFIAVETWTQNKDAGSTARLEVEAFERLADVVREVPRGAEKLRQLLFVYAYEVELTEWGLRPSKFSTAGADATLSEMRRAATSLAFGSTPGPVSTEIFQSIDQLSEARRSRLSIVRERGDAYKWGMVLALSFFTHIAVGIVHADKPKARFVSVGLFSLALCSSMAIMAIHDNPYRGPSKLEQPNLLEIQARLFSISQSD